MTANSNYGRRLIPHVIDEKAKSNPGHIWAGAPIDDDNIAKGFKYYTIANLANAINWLAHYLTRELGGKSESFETIAYLGPNDIRYFVVAIAAVKAGYTALFVSPRNSLEAQINLFEKTKCKTILYPSSHADVATEWQQNRQMKAIALPSIDDLMFTTDAEDYPYTAEFEEARFHPFVNLHTSGSTGFPKPIVVRAGLFAIEDAFHNVPDFDGRPNWINHVTKEASSLFVPMPLFHAAGLYFTIGLAFYYDVKLFMPPPSKPSSTSITEACLRTSKAEGAVIAPSTLEEFANDPNAVKLLASLKCICTGSANIATNVGDFLVKNGVHLQNVIGSTEHTPYSTYRQDADDWAYFCINDDICGFEWRPVEEDVYELWIVRKAEDPGLQACFYTFPDLQEWSTRDLYKKHPTRPNNWIYYGRADNIVVLSNGEKLNPVTIEDEITGHTLVRSALVVGQNRFQPGLFIEPNQWPKNEEETQALVDEIWPSIQKVNKITVAHGRIQRSFIALTNRNKPFPRAGKGTIQRAMATTLYKDEIEQLYKAAAEMDLKKASTLDISSLEALTASLQKVIDVQLEQGEIGPDTDFFSAGMDSVHLLALSRVLTGSLKRTLGESSPSNLASPRVLYQNPTSRSMALYILTQLGNPAEETSQKEQVDKVQIMVDKYVKDLPLAQSLKAPMSAATSNLTVVLTGSTGSLGSYLLELLNSHPLVSKVITFNRAKDSQIRQVDSSSSRGLSTSFPKTTFLTTDLAQAQLGLSEQDYNKVAQETDIIIHNQWQVDFNLSLPSFEPLVHGTRQLVNLSIASPKRPRIIFTTTVAEVAGWKPDTPSGSVPEHPLPGHTIPAFQGYGASKLAASRILETASEVSSVPYAIVRVGQVAGPVDRPQGSWNRWEWFPSIVASSSHLNTLPSRLGSSENFDEIAWVPVEREAQLLVDITLSGATGYFNGVNPRSASYTKDVLPVLKEYLGGEAKATKEIVPWSEWMERLAASEPETQTTEQLERNPGVKLMDFYGSLSGDEGSDALELKWDTERSQSVSQTWRELKPVQAEWLRLWLKQWGLSREV